MTNHIPVVIAGLSLAVWVDLFNGCHTTNGVGLNQFEWPDGGNYLNQDNVLVFMFKLIEQQYDKASKNGK